MPFEQPLPIEANILLAVMAFIVIGITIAGLIKPIKEEQ